MAADAIAWVSTLVRMPVRITETLVIPDAELTERFSRSGGPGGQHANKASTRVELTWDIATSEVLSDHRRSILTDHFGDVLRIVVDDERSQARNREIAEERLIGRVSAALKPQRRRVPTRKTRSSQRRRLDTKRRDSEQKRLRRKPRRDD